MQADITLGNLASALTIHTEETALNRRTPGGIRGSILMAHQPLPPADLQLVGAHRPRPLRRR